MKECQICHQYFQSITRTHLLGKHGISIKAYNKKFDLLENGFMLTVKDLSKSDPRYRHWRKRLFERPPVWNKGFKKMNHPGVAKISMAFRRKKIDNFSRWRNYLKEIGKIPSYEKFPKSDHLAFLIGLILGDGNITEFPKTEKLTIVLHIKYPALIAYTKVILEAFFQKKISLREDGNSIRLSLYQKFISKRLGILTGSRKNIRVMIPKWVWQSRKYLIAYLKGLFEAEGSLSIHQPTYTYNLQFSNRNFSLLKNVGKILEFLGFHPEYRKDSTRLRRRKEVEQCTSLINFRQYCGVEQWQSRQALNLKMLVRVQPPQPN